MTKNFTVLEQFVLKRVIFCTQTGKGHTLSVYLADTWVTAVPCVSATVRGAAGPQGHHRVLGARMSSTVTQPAAQGAWG